MLFSPTETPGDAVVAPLAGISWRGWIELDRGRIAGIETLGADHVSDRFERADDRRVWFSCKTRGDFDGVLLRLEDAPADAALTVRIAALEPDGEGAAGARMVDTLLPGPPDETSLHTARVRLDSPGVAKFDVTPFARVLGRRVSTKGQWDVTFHYRPERAPQPGDYYYLRAVQIDGEAAWSSPVWAAPAR
jgi:hypothetical protein